MTAILVILTIVGFVTIDCAVLALRRQRDRWVRDFFVGKMGELYQCDGPARKSWRDIYLRFVAWVWGWHRHSATITPDVWKCVLLDTGVQEAMRRAGPGAVIPVPAHVIREAQRAASFFGVREPPEDQFAQMSRSRNESQVAQDLKVK